MAGSFWSSGSSLAVFFALAIRFLLSFAQPAPSYNQFVFNATIFPPEDYYDYIIVGGGTAGCPLAATLSSSYRVLLLERGGLPTAFPNLMTQDGFLMNLMEADMIDSPAQAFTSEEGVPNTRGRVLGGSSAINAGFYSRADGDFYRFSGINWDMREVNQSYEWVENAIVSTPELKNWQVAVRNGLLEAGVQPFNGFTVEHKVGTKLGGSTFDTSGRRHSAADLLNLATPSNIRVAIHATVERVIISSSAPAAETYQQAASGVVYRDRLGRYHHAWVRDRGEVILCAGAIGTPQLLLLSGVGARPYLSYWGIPVIHHLPFVGQYMFDNPRNGISIIPPTPLGNSLIQVVGITESGAYIEAASTVVPFTWPVLALFIRSPAPPLYLTVATLMEKIIGPLSTGSLRLASTDVRVNPIVRFNYFSHPSDLERCVNGTRIIGEILRGRSMEGFRFREWFGRRDFRYVGPQLPVDMRNTRLVEDFCRRTVSTIWHYHGGAVIGRVVDQNFRVMGLDRLRIVDGSTFGISPGTNPQATLLMLGRYIGQMMKKERGRNL